MGSSDAHCSVRSRIGFALGGGRVAPGHGDDVGDPADGREREARAPGDRVLRAPAVVQARCDDGRQCAERERRQEHTDPGQGPARAAAVTDLDAEEHRAAAVAGDAPPGGFARPRLRTVRRRARMTTKRSASAPMTAETTMTRISGEDRLPTIQSTLTLPVLTAANAISTAAATKAAIMRFSSRALRLRSCPGGGSPAASGVSASSDIPGSMPACRRVRSGWRPRSATGRGW